MKPWVSIACAASGFLVARLAWAEPFIEMPPDVVGPVADELFQQAETAYTKKDVALGCQLAWEAAEYQAGNEAAAAAALSARCRREHGFVPFVGVSAAGPVAQVPTEILNPYDETPVTPAPPSDAWPLSVSTQLYGFGAGFGFWAGTSLGVGAGGKGSVAGGLGLLGAAGGVAGAYFAARNDKISQGQALAVMSGGTWGAVQGLFLAHAISDLGEPNHLDTSTYFLTSFVTGAAGLGVGIAAAVYADPEPRTVATGNSLGLYGGLGGLVLGGIMQPARDGGYSMNVLVGGTLGTAGGLLFAKEIGLSRQRLLWIDLGVSAGALPGLIGLAAADGGTQQAISAVSLGLMAGGGYLGWRWGKSKSAQAAPDLAVGSLLWRQADGRWSAGLPLVIQERAADGRVALTLALAQGQF